MDFLGKLDKVLNSVVLLREKFENEVIPRVVWMTSDIDQHNLIARTNSKSTFWQNVAKMIDDAGTPIVGLKVSYKDGQPYIRKEDRNEVIGKLLRREARRTYQERQASFSGKQARTKAPGMAKSVNLNPLDTDKLDPRSATEVATSIAQPRKYTGDAIYSIVGAGDEVVRDDMMTQDEADTWLSRLAIKDNGREDEKRKYFVQGSDGVVRTDFATYEDAKDWVSQLHVQERENPKSLSILMKTKLPLQHGWTVEEVTNAMRPIIYKLAGKYHGLKIPKEDLVQIGYIGVLDTLRTDKGEAPFVYHATQTIRGQMARAVRSGTLIKGSEKQGGGAQGVLQGYKVIWVDKEDKPHMKYFPADISAYQRYFSTTGRSPARSIDPNFKLAQEYAKDLKDQGAKAVDIKDDRTQLTSADKPSGEEGESTRAGLYRSRIPNPSYIATQLDLLRKVMDKSGLSDQQKKAIEIAYGLDVPEGSLSQKGFRAPERGQGEKQPGEQIGFPAVKPSDRQSGFKEHGMQRDPNEIADIMGISTQRARQHLTTALGKIKKATEGTRFENYIRAALGLLAESEVDKIVWLDRAIGSCLVEMIMTGAFDEDVIS